MDKDITPRNEQGHRHGYWEEYYSNGQLFFKGNYINGEKDGIWLEYRNNFYPKFFYKNSKRYYKNRFIGIRFQTF